jgi:hypothetical protein
MNILAYFNASNNRLQSIIALNIKNKLEINALNLILDNSTFLKIKLEK